jgi:hypothetical protein
LRTGSALLALSIATSLVWLFAFFMPTTTKIKARLKI